MSAASVTLPVHFVDATRDAIRAYSHGADAGRSSRASSNADSSSRRSSGASLASSTKSNASSTTRKQSSYRSRISGSSVKAPVVETLYSGSASGRTTPSGQSLASSASTGTQPSWLTKSNDWTTTGNSTDRSSVFSLGDWGEDEFDRAATRKVKGLFEDVDSWMFEQEERVEGNLSQTSRKECVEWVEKFVHCRTLGTQLLAPKDGVGYEVVAADAVANRPATGSFLIDVTENEMAAVIPDHLPSYALCLNGKSVKPVEIPPAQMAAAASAEVGGGGGGGGVGVEVVGSENGSGPLRADMCHLVEEIFEQDGKIEEYLAYDSRKFYSSSNGVTSSVAAAVAAGKPHRHSTMSAESKRHHHHRRHRHHHPHHDHHTESQPSYRMDKSGLPPITPTGCLRDSIVSGIFDLIWSNYMSWIQHVLQPYHASVVNEIVYKRLKSGVALSSRTNHDHAAALLAKGAAGDPYSRLVMTSNLRRGHHPAVDYAQGRIGAGGGSQGGGGGGGVLSSQSSSSSSFITSVPVVGMVGVGLDSGRPSSRLSSLTSRYTSFSNVGQPDMTTLDGVLTISSKALHYQHKQQQQQQQQPPMTPSSHHRVSSSLGSHGLQQLQQQQQQQQLYLHHSIHPDNNNASSLSSKNFSGSIMHVEDHHHHHHHLVHESSPSFHVMHSVHPNNNNNNSGPSSSSTLRGLTSASGPSPSSFNHHQSYSTRPQVNTISLTSNNNNHNTIVAPSSSLGHNNNVVANNRNHNNNNLRSVESTPPSTSILLGGTPARASAVGPRGRSRTQLQPLDRAKTPVISDHRGGGGGGGGGVSGGDENDPLGGGGISYNNNNFPAVSIGLEMVRGIGIASSASPPLGMPRNLPPLETDAHNGALRLNNNNSGSSKRKNSIRASSAISDKNPRNVTSGTLKNRALRGIVAGRDLGAGGGGAGQDDRPNTTHTFRTDLVHFGGGGGGGTPSSNRRALSPPEGTNRHSRASVIAPTTQQQQQQQQQQQITSNNTAMGFGVVGHSEDKPIMLTGISLTPFNAHPLESMHHHHPSEEDEDLFVGGGAAAAAAKSGSGSGAGEEASWNQAHPNRVSKSPGNQRLVTSGQALKSRGRLGPFI